MDDQEWESDGEPEESVTKRRTISPIQLAPAVLVVLTPTALVYTSGQAAALIRPTNTKWTAAPSNRQHLREPDETRCSARSVAAAPRCPWIRNLFSNLRLSTLSAGPCFIVV